MGDLDNYCLVGKPVIWQDVAAQNLASAYLTRPDLARRAIDAAIEIELAEARRCSRG